MIEAFATLKSRLELAPSFDDKIQARHAAVRSALQHIEPAITTKLIGSLARKTRIQPRAEDIFDIDVLVVRSKFTRWVSSGGLTADQAIDGMLNVVQQSERYAAKNPSPDKPTISIGYEDKTKVEIVPAYLDNIGQSSNGTKHSPIGRAYWVPKPNGWELADYDYDAAYVSAQNDESGGILVPTIKMLKAIKRNMFPEVPSFYFEMLATFIVGAIARGRRQAGATSTYPGLITAFFETAVDGWLDMPLVFPNSLTKYVSLNPAVAQRAKRAFGVLAEYCRSIDPVTAVTEKKRMWREIIGDPFPSQ